MRWWCLHAAQVGSARCRAAPCGAGLCCKMCCIHPCPGRGAAGTQTCPVQGCPHGDEPCRVCSEVAPGRGELGEESRGQSGDCRSPAAATLIPRSPWDLPAQAILSSALSKPEVSLWEQERLVLCLLYPGFLRSQQLSTLHRSTFLLAQFLSSSPLTSPAPSLPLASLLLVAARRRPAPALGRGADAWLCPSLGCSSHLHV